MEAEIWLGLLEISAFCHSAYQKQRVYFPVFSEPE